jgi:hypothetical protein
MLAQIRACLPEPHTLPEDTPIHSRNAACEIPDCAGSGAVRDVAELLGRKAFFRESSYKECLVSRMQELRMVSFALSTPYLYTCTRQIELPAGTVDRPHGRTIVMVRERNGEISDLLGNIDARDANGSVSRFPSQFARLLTQYQDHPEAKSLAPDGTPCKGDTKRVAEACSRDCRRVSLCWEGNRSKMGRRR